MGHRAFRYLIYLFVVCIITYLSLAFIFGKHHVFRKAIVCTNSEAPACVSSDASKEEIDTRVQELDSDIASSIASLKDTFLDKLPFKWLKFNFSYKNASYIKFLITNPQKYEALPLPVTCYEKVRIDANESAIFLVNKSLEEIGEQAHVLIDKLNSCEAKDGIYSAKRLKGAQVNPNEKLIVFAELIYEIDVFPSFFSSSLFAIVLVVVLFGTVAALKDFLLLLRKGFLAWFLSK